MRERPPKILPLTSSETEVPRPQLAYADLSIDMDVFDGRSDDDLMVHLRNLGTFATEGQLKMATGLEPTSTHSHEELVELYIEKTMDIVRRLRA